MLKSSKIKYSTIALLILSILITITACNTLSNKPNPEPVQAPLFITYNDEQSGHIARNLIFNSEWIKTWNYAHSASMSYVGIVSKCDKDARHILWSYLYYDNYVTWNKDMKS